MVTRATSIEAVRHRPEADTFDVAASVWRLRGIIFGHKLLIACCCALTLGLVITYIELFPPVYKASVFLNIETKTPNRDYFYIDWNLFRKGDVASEGEMMTAPGPVAKVVEKFGLTYDDVYHTPLNHLRYLWQKSALGKFYKRVKEMIWPPPRNANGPTRDEVERARTVHAFRDGAALNWVSGTDAAYLVVKGPSPKVSEYANALIDIYRDMRRQRFVDEAKAAADQLQKDAARARAARARAVQAKAEFDTEHQLVIGEEKDRATLQLWSKLKGDIEDLEAEKLGLEAELRVMHGLLAKEHRTVLKSRTEARNTTRENVKRMVIDAEASLVKARQQFRDDSPEVRRLEEQVADLKRTLSREQVLVRAASTNEINNTYSGLQDRRNQTLVRLSAIDAELAPKRGEFAKLSARLKEVPALLMRSGALKKDVEIAESHYNAMMEKLSVADASLSSARAMPSTIHVVEYAHAPFLPAWPKKKLLLIIGLVFGLAGGVALAIVADVLGERVNHGRLSIRPDLPLYATIEVSRRGDAERLRRLAAPAPDREGDGSRAVDRLTGGE